MVDSLPHKKVLLGISGGVAAYKSCELLRLLTASDKQVEVVMTRGAQQFVGVQTMHALSTQPVITDFLHGNDAMAHITSTRNADAFVIAPATANVLAKIAHGIADDVLTATVLARRTELPLIVAPAMNVEMWQAAVTKENIQKLQTQGITIAEPTCGMQACEEEGYGRMLEVGDIHAIIERALTPPLLKDKKVVITAGPTFERIDAVRGITNLSSGKMGYALAKACYAAGANVYLISGPTHLPPPFGMKILHVQTAREMLAAVKQCLPDTDWFIAAAAVVDWNVKNPSLDKIKKDGQRIGLPHLQWEENPDIVAYVGKWATQNRRPYLLGFSAETNTQNMLAVAEQKSQIKQLDAICANNFKNAFANDSNEITLITAKGRHYLGKASKQQLAQQIIAAIALELTF